MLTKPDLCLHRHLTLRIDELSINLDGTQYVFGAYMCDECHRVIIEDYFEANLRKRRGG
jgi:hypothetical protein